MQDRPVPVLRVGPLAGPIPALDLAPALAWFAERSAGRFTPRAGPLATLQLDGLGRFRGLGGLDRHPHGSQALVGEALAQLDAGARAQLARLAPALIVLVPAGFRPHCWHLTDGQRSAGLAAHRYTLIPDDATLGAVVHELGHLLLGWPDLERDSGLGSECLMARGALLPDPAPPCAALRLHAGWITPRPVDRTTRVEELAVGEAVMIGERVIERRRDPDRLLIVRDGPRPLLLRRISLGPADLERPLLAVARFGEVATSTGR